MCCTEVSENVPIGLGMDLGSIVGSAAFMCHVVL